jgi:hypothetical protein
MAVDVLTLSILLVIHSIIVLCSSLVLYMLTWSLYHTAAPHRSEQTDKQNKQLPAKVQRPAPTSHRRPSQRGFVLHEP